MTDFPQPLISIDVVPVRFDAQRGKAVFAVAERLFEPFIGELALPGVLLNPGETIDGAAKRALAVKAGLQPGTFHQFGAFDGTNRDPRGATISIAMLSAQDRDDAGSAIWLDEVPTLPFDHTAIVTAALNELSAIMWKDLEFTRALLGEEFSTQEVLQVGSPTPLASNTGRWLKNSGLVTDTGRTQRVGGSGRPSKIWSWK